MSIDRSSLMRSVAALVVILSSNSASAQTPTHRIEIADHQTIQASIGYEIRTTNFAVARWTAFLPEPPELPSQIKIKTTTEPAGKLIAEKSPIARKVRLFDVPVASPVAGAKLTLRHDIQATLLSRKLVLLKEDEKPPNVPALAIAERKFYLAPSNRVDFDKPDFKEWLDAKKLRRAKGEAPLDFALRAMKVLRDDYKYEYDQEDEKRASVTCSRTKTDCGGMSFIFVAAMRANDIPARVLIGRLANPRRPGSNPTDTDYDQPHVRTELHVAGVGWVCVDPSYANRDKHRTLEELLGFDPGDMLVLHADLDLRLPVSDKEQIVDLLQVEPYIWTQGRGKSDATLGPTKWDFKTTLKN